MRFYEVNETNRIISTLNNVNSNFEEKFQKTQIFSRVCRIK